MGKILSKNRLVTVGLTVAVIAAAMRWEPSREFISGEQKFLGIF